MRESILSLLALFLLPTGRIVAQETPPEAPMTSVRLLDEARAIAEIFSSDVDERYQEGTNRYLNLLSTPHDSLSVEALEALRRHVDALSLIVPELTAREAGLPADQDEHWSAEALDASVVRGWWRSQDPRPGTGRNERLEEFLTRVHFAWEHFCPNGAVDDRGSIYIRLGPPSRRVTVDLNRSGMPQWARDDPASLRARLPQNEFWSYQHVDASLHYLFIKSRDGRYRIGDSADLVSHVANSPRHSEFGLRLMEEVYRQLSLQHIDYSTVYTEVADFLQSLDSSRFTRPREMPRPDTFLRAAYSNAGMRDGQIRTTRDQRTPQTYSRVMDAIEPLDLQVRTARFLEKDGTTRTEVFWSGFESAFHPGSRSRRILRSEGFSANPERYLLNASLTERDGQFETRAVTRDRHLVRTSRDGEGIVSPQPYVTHQRDGPFHLSLQVDQYAVSEEEPGDYGPLVKTAVFHFDSLSVLRRGSGLEMSDLKPVLLSDGASLPSRKDGRGAPAYPFAALMQGVPVALYFEIYHLDSGPEGGVHYSVEYAVTRPAGFDSRGRPLTGEQTSARVRHRGETSTVYEFVYPDTEDWQLSGSTEMTVRVRDEITGEEVERRINFLFISDLGTVFTW